MNENENTNCQQLAKAFEHQSKIVNNKIEKLRNDFNKIYNSYKEFYLQTDVISQKINTLKCMYDYEIKLNEFYHSYTNVPKRINVASHEVSKSQMFILDNNISQLTEEQQLKIITNRNEALIKCMKKQLYVTNLELDEKKTHFVLKYKKYLHNKYT